MKLLSTTLLSNVREVKKKICMSRSTERCAESNGCKLHVTDFSQRKLWKTETIPLQN